MKQTLLLFLLGVISLTTKAQTPANPIIKDYGTINAIDNVYMPDKNIEYKIVIVIKPSNNKCD